MWQWLMTDVTTVAKDVLELNQNRPEKQVYMSLPRPGVSKFFPNRDFESSVRQCILLVIAYLLCVTIKHVPFITETRHNEQTAETGKIGQRGAGQDRESGPGDEAHHFGDGRGNGEVAGERKRPRGKQ